MSDARHTAWDCHTCQIAAACENAVSNACHTFRNRHTCQAAAVIEDPGLDSSQPGGYRHGSDLILVQKQSILTDERATAVNARSKIDVKPSVQICDVNGHLGAECRKADLRNRRGDRHVFQAVAAIECIISNDCYSFWDRHARQSAAIAEPISSDARHTVLKYDGCDRAHVVGPWSCITVVIRHCPRPADGQHAVAVQGPGQVVPIRSAVAGGDDVRRSGLSIQQYCTQDQAQQHGQQGFACFLHKIDSFPPLYTTFHISFN